MTDALKKITQNIGKIKGPAVTYLGKVIILREIINSYFQKMLTLRVKALKETSKNTS